jgi:hypothetical protein
MKKILLLLIVLVLSTCQISIEPKEVFAQDSISSQMNSDGRVHTFIKNADGMTYRIFMYGNGYAGAAIVIMNLTKEKLEVEKLKLEIKKLKQ